MASASDSFGYNNDFALYLTATEVAIDTPNNRTQVSVTSYVKNNSYSGNPIHNGNTTTGYTTVDGKNMATNIGSYSFNSPGQLFYLENNYTQWITHNSNGSKTISISTSYNGDNSPWLDSAATSLSLTLTTINRTASFTSFGVSNVTDVGFTVYITADVNCSNIEVSVDNGSTWVSLGSGTSKQYVATNKPSGQSFTVKGRLTRADSGLQSTSSGVSVTTALQNNFLGIL